jgi:predicted nucleic acid-binding protein
VRPPTSGPLTEVEFLYSARNAEDLLVATTAELQGLTMLHYDNDFETIASVTGQPTQWLAPPGDL